MIKSRDLVLTDYFSTLPPELFMQIAAHLSLIDFGCLIAARSDWWEHYHFGLKLNLLKDAVVVDAITSDESRLYVQMRGGKFFAKEWSSHRFKLMYQTLPGERFIAHTDSFFVLSAGRVKAWGDNSEGQLGLGDVLQDEQVDVPVWLSINEVKEVCTTGISTYFLMNDGTVKVCGNNDEGQLGFPERFPFAVPRQIPALTNVSKISASSDSDHVFFLLTNGQVMACGKNNWGQLGMGDLVSLSSPRLIPELNNVRDIVAGATSYFILKDGTVKSCGHNLNHTVGYLPQHASELVIPRLIPALSGVKKIVASFHCVAFLLDDGSVKLCGRYNGVFSPECYVTPTRIPELNYIRDAYIDAIGMRYRNVRFYIVFLDDFGLVHVYSQHNPFINLNAAPQTHVINTNLSRLSGVQMQLRLQKCIATSSMYELLYLANDRDAYGDACWRRVMKLLWRGGDDLFVLTTDSFKLISQSPWRQTDQLVQAVPGYHALLDYIELNPDDVSDHMLLSYQKLLKIYRYLHQNELPIALADFHCLLESLSFGRIASIDELFDYMMNTKKVLTRASIKVGRLKLFDVHYDCADEYIFMRNELLNVPFRGLAQAVFIFCQALCELSPASKVTLPDGRQHSQRRH